MSSICSAIARISFLVASCIVSHPSLAAPEDTSDVIGLAQLHRLDLLPVYKHVIKVGNVSSYDRTGGNDDGFSGKYSFVRKEGDNLVLADLVGPGCLYRFHTPTPTDDIIEFYFDGESAPRIHMPLRRLFDGTQRPFVKPLVNGAGGGYYSYVPLCYQKSCKVLLRARTFQFYDLNYATFRSGTNVETFGRTVSVEDNRHIEQIQEVFAGGRTKDLTNYNMPTGAKVTKTSFDKVLHPGKTVTVFASKQGGRIGSLRIGPAHAFASKERDIYLRVTWDNDRKPAILCPIGDFFGYAWGKPAMGDFLVGTSENENYCNIPMPFDHSAKIELISLRPVGPDIRFQGEVAFSNKPRRPDEAKFYAVWRRENPTTEGKPFTFIQTKGRGHIIGLALQAQGKVSGSTTFFEGDDETTIDGELVIHGTGSEDFFNGGWYDVPDRWDRQFALPLSGCMAFQKHLGRSGAYRFFIGDAYSFEHSVLQTIEHAPEQNRLMADYCSVTYLYCESNPTESDLIPSPDVRRVSDLADITFAADWTLPISSFSFRDATISRTSVPSGANEQTRCLSLRTKGEDWFGPAFLAVVCDLPTTGKYKVYVNAVSGPEQGVIQLFRNEAPVGEPVDLYTEQPATKTELYLGEISADEGDNRLMFKIISKNGKSRAFGFDLVQIICRRS